MEIIYNPDTIDYMYRYLERYVGKYRVVAEYDIGKNKFPNDKTFEDYYIPCSEGCVIKHTYEGNDILALFFYEDKSLARKTATKLRREKIKFKHDFKNDILDAIILFHSSDINKVAKIVGAETKGKNTSPTSIRNLPKEIKKKEKYKVPEEDIQKLDRISPALPKVEKMQYFRKHNKEFLKKIDKQYGDNYSKTEIKKTGLTTREFIHKMGYWKEYIKYIKSLG